MLAQTEWATPMLYFRAQDGNLFERIESGDQTGKAAADVKEKSSTVAASPTSTKPDAAAPKLVSGLGGEKTAKPENRKWRVLTASIILVLFLSTTILNVPSDDGAPADIAETS